MTPSEARIALSKADADRKAAKRVIKASRPPRVKHVRAVPVAKEQRDPRQRDAAFLSWLHVDLPCIACLVEGLPEVARGRPWPIEAAHQKLNLAVAGWKKISGSRVHDRQCCPLCEWHHRSAPNACDNGQAKFWRRILGDEARVADLCRNLYATFKDGRPGAPIIQAFAHPHAERNDR